MTCQDVTAETLTLVPKTNIDRDAAHRTLEDN